MTAAPRLSDLVLEFYDRERRILPWREDPTPYHVWLSEIMLQQTRVDTVIPYFERFTSRFPDVLSLASAEEDEVLKLWEGLGYYSRARNLHRAARIVAERHGGVVPHDKESLLALPGVGAYTAGAILSIAYGEAETTIDGNFYRVGSRLTGCEKSIDAAAGKKELESFWRSVLPADRPGDFNQAVMDIGATICLPNGAPLCARCPVRRVCRAAESGNPGLLPVRSAKKERPVERRTVFVLRDEAGRMMLRKRPKGGLLGGMWEFPSIAGDPAGSERPGDAEIVHVFSHVEWRLKLRILCREALLAAEEESLYRAHDGAEAEIRWFSETEIEELALAAVFRKVLEAIRRRS